MDSELLQTLQDGVLTLTLNRPAQRNALTTALNLELVDALGRASRDRDVKVVVLTGAGPAFCAGGDVKGMAERARTEPTLEDRSESLTARAQVSRLLHEMPKPTIAAVRGAAAGAGFSIALSCDLRIASDTARFRTSFIGVGLSGDFGCAYFLTHLVGSARARELMLLSPTVSATEALALGLVTRLVPDGQLDTETAALAVSLARGPSLGYGYMKRNINVAEAGATLAECLELESILNARCTLTPDHADAVAAFAEKRDPVFIGRG